MAEFKKLSDVEIIETPIDTANVLIEEGGVIKKAPKSAVGTVKSVNGVEADENGDVAIETAASWNDLKDKPFYEEAKKSLVVEGMSNSYGSYSLQLGESIVTGKTYTFIIDNVEYTGIGYYDDSSGMSIDLSNTEGSTVAYVGGFNIQLLSEFFDLTVPHKIEYLDIAIKPLDEKYIPDIALAKSFIIDRANGTITIGKTTSPQFYYEAAEDYYRLTDDNFYNLAKAAIELGLCTICYKTEDNDDITYELSAGSTVWIPKENGNIRINDFYINKQNS